MRASLLGTALALLASCGSIDTAQLWTGVHAADQAQIRSAARALTNSPIRDWHLDDNAKPTRIIFYTKDGKMYYAKKMRGKWHIEYLRPEAIVGLITSDLTRRCSQPLHRVQPKFPMTKTPS